jgi:hypothetical protein
MAAVAVVAEVYGWLGSLTFATFGAGGKTVGGRRGSHDDDVIRRSLLSSFQEAPTSERKECHPDGEMLKTNKSRDGDWVPDYRLCYGPVERDPAPGFGTW